MDTVIHFISLGIIPLLALLIFSGFREIYHGLKEHYEFSGFRVSELTFNQNKIDLSHNFGYRKINTSFCKS